VILASGCLRGPAAGGRESIKVGMWRMEALGEKPDVSLKMEALLIIPHQCCCIIGCHLQLPQVHPHDTCFLPESFVLMSSWLLASPINILVTAFDVEGQRLGLIGL